MRDVPPIVSPTDTIDDARARVGGTATHALVALPGAWSLVAAADLERLAADGHGADTVAGTVDYQRVPAVHRDQPLDVALRLLGDRPLLPVVHRADASRLEGVLTLEAILEGYRRTHVPGGDL
jgi:CBS domain-containing protein